MRFLREAAGLPVERIVRTYPQPAEGWVEGVYRPRAEKLSASPLEAAPAEPLRMRGARFVEESEALGDDPNTIAHTVYREGDALRFDVPACTWHLTLAVSCTGCARADVVVNGDSRVRLPGDGVARTVSMELPLTQRALELSFSPEGEGACEAHVSELALERMTAPSAGSRADAGQGAPRIFIAGDSTAQTYADGEAPQAGWGEWLYWYLYDGHTASVYEDAGSDPVQSRVFTGSGPTIFNRALGGRGTRSYLAEHRLERIAEQLRAGDILLIALGINDASPDRPMRYVSEANHASYLERFAVTAQDRGAIPVIVTSTPQFPYAGHEDAIAGLERYADIERAFARDHGIPLIDLRAEGEAYVALLPRAGAEALYLRAPAGQYPAHPHGVADWVHLSTLGAFKFAGIVARGLETVCDGVTVHAPCEREPSALGALTALVHTDIPGVVVDMDWDASGAADYYTVEKRSARTGRLYRTVATLKPHLRDTRLPGQDERIVYTVRAWVDDRSGTPSSVEVELPVSDDPRITVD